MEFNKEHPELKDGEIWAMNEAENSTAMIFDSMRYRTKRFGVTAYDDEGNILPNMRPIFIKKIELDYFFDKKTTQKAYLIETGIDSFRLGEPTEIIGVVFTRQPIMPRPAYYLKYTDGFEGPSPVIDSNNFIIISEDMIG